LQAGPEHLEQRGRGGLQEVLAVVDDQQHRLVRGRAQQGVERVEAELRRQRPGDGVGVVDAGQVDVTHPQGEPVHHAIGHQPGQYRLAHPARSDDRDQAVGARPGLQLGDLAIATDEASRRHPASVGGPRCLTM
jgi:hypothetical protein